MVFYEQFFNFVRNQAIMTQRLMVVLSVFHCYNMSSKKEDDYIKVERRTK